MEVYLVGGAVRDRLLGLPVRERDWVVVGARPADLQAQGSLPVGREFPVFLHPVTHEEYALARVERKVAPGYRGFTTEFSPDVTLEDDLRRRDLTINAMAESGTGEVIDPYGGRRDLDARVLRHVSDAFIEDPVRVLRVARFAARYADRGFTVAEETRDLMKRMVDSGEVDALVAERVWKETERALSEPRPEVFFEVLRDCGALRRIFPEIEALFGVPQPEKWHPEIDTGVHTMMVLRCAARLSSSTTVRFAALVHDLGKARTPPELWPSHRGHEEAGVVLIESMAERLRVPNGYRDLAVLTSRYHAHVHRALELRPATVVKLFEETDAFRRPERFGELLLACEADARGRLGLEDREYPQPEFLRRALDAASAVALSDEDRREFSGPALGQRMHDLRVQAVKGFKEGS
jgi:tRNA nucleotidyltransferase (CCA-adding enzyme)